MIGFFGVFLSRKTPYPKELEKINIKVLGI